KHRNQLRSDLKSHGAPVRPRACALASRNDEQGPLLCHGIGNVISLSVDFNDVAERFTQSCLQLAGTHAAPGESLKIIFRVFGLALLRDLDRPTAIGDPGCTATMKRSLPTRSLLT